MEKSLGEAITAFVLSSTRVIELTDGGRGFNITEEPQSQPILEHVEAAMERSVKALLNQRFPMFH